MNHVYFLALEHLTAEQWEKGLAEKRASEHKIVAITEKQKKEMELHMRLFKSLDYMK